MNSSDDNEIIHLVYHHEDGGWWAESFGLPSLYAGGDTLDDARELARQVVAEEVGSAVTLTEWAPHPGSAPETQGATRGGPPATGVLKGWASQEREVWTHELQLPEAQTV